MAGCLIDASITLAWLFDESAGNRSLVGLAQTARPYQLTAYDAVYLDLAIGLGLPPLTDDSALRRAAQSVGVLAIDPAVA
jgi:predicted nucleic acid-binding protein